MHGSSATAQQSQSTDILHITFIYTMFPLNMLWTDDATSAIASKNLFCSGKLSHNFSWSFVTPAECIQAFPSEEPQPIDNCFNAPPYPPIGWPLKCDNTNIES